MIVANVIIVFLEVVVTFAPDTDEVNIAGGMLGCVFRADVVFSLANDV